MKHHVFYFPDADKAVQLLISEADDPQAMMRAFETMDRWLSRWPLNIGESRIENVRVAFEKPIAVQYEVLKDPPTVIVYAAWRTE